MTGLDFQIIILLNGHERHARASNGVDNDSMSFNNRLATIRKDKKVSQGELALKVGVHANLIGRYERGEAIPSVEIAAKIATELDTSLDYLIGLSELKIDHDLLIRVREITILSDEDKRQLYAVIDALLRDYKAKR